MKLMAKPDLKLAGGRMSGQTYTGASGRFYPFLLADTYNLDLLPLQGGNYIFALDDAYRTPIFIDGSQSVREAVSRNGMHLWKLARTLYGAKFVLIHVDPRIDDDDQEKERNDLIEAYRPVMNPSPEPAA
jgi:hypothetical protein